MKKQERITELQEYIAASGIEETLDTLKQMFGAYIHLKKMKDQKKEIRFGYLEVIETIWKMEEVLKLVIEKSKEWEESANTDNYYSNR